MAITEDKNMHFAHKPTVTEEASSIANPSPVEIVCPEALDAEIVLCEQVESGKSGLEEKERQLYRYRYSWMNFVELSSVILRWYEDIVSGEQQIIKAGGREAAVLLAFGSVAGIILMSGNTLPALVLAGAASLFLVICGIDMILKKFLHPK